jgi:N-acyl homoserine lactone hydrolase
MRKWKITAIQTGTIEMEKSIGTYLKNNGVVVNIPSISFVLESLDESETIIVDTGFESVERSERIQKQRAWRSEDQNLEAVLRDTGIKPELIRTGILTHLHFDHCGQNHLFPNAKFYVQHSELRYAFTPLPDEYTPYFSPLIGEMPSFLGTDFEIIEGDAEITDGVRVVHTPGHTPGGQTVLVETSGGVYAIPGDNVFFYENIENNIPCGHIYSRADWFSSMKKVRSMSDYIIPSHENLLFRETPAVFPRST